MTFPAPLSNGFPTPSGGFPAPPALADPMFGVNPYQSGNMYTVGYVDNSLGLPDLQMRAAALDQLQSQARVAAMAQLGAPVQSDPTGWTPQDAATQTDQAIAKIAAVNPQLADKLQAQRMPDQQDSGGGLLDGIGHLLAPALNIGGKVLDFVGRTANLVPNLAYDIVDGKDFHPLADVSGALTGTVRHNWNSVFQEAGWTGDGFGGFMRATLGFAGDIVTDPLTWLIPQGAAARQTAEALAEQSAKQATAHSGALLEAARAIWGGTDEELVPKLLDRLNYIQSSARQAGMDVTEEGAWALVGEGVKTGEEALMRDLFDVYSKGYAMFRTRSFNTFARKGVIDLASGGQVTGREMKQVLEDIVKSGAWNKGPEWEQARNLAVALRGTRFKFQVPFTSLRYISPAVPGTAFLGEKLISPFARMFAGQSGLNRMFAAIGEGKGSWADLQTWMEQGFDKAYEQNPDLVNGLRGRFNNLGSMFYSASEQLGGITAHFSSGAAATRTGLAGYFANAERKRVEDITNNFMRETAYRIESDGGKTERDRLLRDLERELGISLRKKKVTATPEQLHVMAKYLDYIPQGLDVSNPQAIDDWFWSLPENVAAKQEAERGASALGPRGELLPQGQDTLQAAEARLSDIHATVNTFSGTQREQLNRLGAIWEHARTEAGKYDAAAMDVTGNYETARVLHPSQVRRWQGNVTHPTLGEDWYFDVQAGGAGARAEWAGVDESMVAAHEDAQGVLVTRRADGTGAVNPTGVKQLRVAIRPGDAIIVDETSDAIASDAADILAARAEAEHIAGAQADAVAALSGHPTGTAMTEEEARREAVAKVTAKLRSEKPDAKAIIYKRANGDMEAVVFDWQDVKAISDKANLVPQERGYLPRYLNNDAREWIRGRLPQEGHQLLVTEPELEAFLHRQTIGMTIDEAEAHIRRLLAETYGQEAAATLPATIFEHNPLSLHLQYINKTGEAIFSALSGKFFRRIVRLGDMAPTMMGKAARGQSYEWMLNPGMLRALQQADSKLTQAVLRANARGVRYMETEHAARAAEAEKFGLLQAMVEESLQSGVEVPSRLVQAARRYGHTYYEAQKRIEREMAGLESEVAGHQATLDRWSKIEEALAQNEHLGHPVGDTAPVVRANADGTYSVKGWVTIDPQYPDGATPMMSQHEAVFMGDETLGQLDPMMRDSMEGSHRVVRVIGEDGSEVDRIYPYQGETNAEAIARYEADNQAPIVIDTGNGPETITPGKGNNYTYLEDSHLAATDLAKPVEFRGKARELTPTEILTLEAGTDEELGQLLQSLIDEGQQGFFHDGKFGLLDPSAMVEAVGPERLKQMAADGQLYIGKDGSILTKDGWLRRGGTKVRDPELARQRIEAAQGQLAWLQDLRSRLRRGDNTMVDTGFEEVVSPQAAVARENRDRLLGIIDRKHASDPTEDAMVQVIAQRMDDPEWTARVWGDALNSATPVSKNVLKYVDPDTGSTTYLYVQGEKGSQQVLGYRTVEAAGDTLTVTAESQQRKGIGVALGVAHAKDAGLTTPDKMAAFLEKQSYSDGGAGLSKKVVDALFPVPQGAHLAEQNLNEAASGLARESAGVAKRSYREGEAMGRRLGRLRRTTQEAIGEANKAYAEFHQVSAGIQPALVKVETAGDLGGLTRMHIPGLEGFAMPSYMAAEFHHMFDKEGPGGLRKAWREFVIGPWKRWATYRWPGFHVRNFFGAFFNNWLGGVQGRDYIFSWRVNRARENVEKWATRAVDVAEFDRYNLDRIFGRSARGQVTYSDLADLMSESGIGRANTMAVYGVGKSTEAVASGFENIGKSNPTAVRRAARKFDTTMRNVSSGVEDFHRVAAWGTGMASTGGDIYGARAFVMLRHGDYSDLTDAEDMVRDIVPFYKWMRTNVPYQIRSLAENPGQVTLVADKLKTYAYDVQGLDRAQGELQQPSWMKQTLALPIPSWVPFIGSKGKDNLKFAMFDLPYADLYNGLQDYMSSALPVVRNVLESYGIQQTVFSAKPLKGEYVKLSGAFALPGISNMLQGIGLAKKGADGELYIQDKVQNILTAWPVYSRFRNFVEGDPQRVSNRLGGLFSMIGGVGIREGDFTEAELDFYYNEVEPLLNEYKSLGIQLPSVKDIQSGQVGAAVGLSAPSVLPAAQFGSDTLGKVA